MTISKEVTHIFGKILVAQPESLQLQQQMVT
jgi:hypothetical protein